VKLAVLFLAVSIGLGNPLAKGGGLVIGNVRDDQGNGIEGLTVVLVPSNASTAVQSATTTDSTGGFQFRNIEPGRYLVELQQNLAPVFREIVDIQQMKNLAISLRRTDTASSISQRITKVLADVDAEDSETRERAVADLSTNKTLYPTQDVLNAVLNAMGEQSIAGLSVRARVGCLRILTARCIDPWTKNQQLRAQSLVNFYGRDKIKLSEDELEAATNFFFECGKHHVFDAKTD
jgi:Carboxypeptidase regulatory-like domain